MNDYATLHAEPSVHLFVVPAHTRKGVKLRGWCATAGFIFTLGLIRIRIRFNDVRNGNACYIEVKLQNWIQGRQPLRGKHGSCRDRRLRGL